MSRIVVIGAGFAGLASAISLAVRGHTVTVLEARADPGGKARACDVGGAHVDLGPTILVDLAPLSELCAVAGGSLEQTVDVQRVDPGLVARFLEGELAFHASPARVAADLACLGPAAARDWESFLALGARAARLADHFNRHGDVRDPRDWLGFLVGGRLALADVAPFVQYPSLAALLKRFIRTSSLRALLGHFARFIGLEATAAPSVALVIPYLLATGGVWYPRGGFSTMVRSLVRLADKHGVALEMGDAVEGVAVYGGRAREIRTVTGRRHPVEAVVAAVDVRITARWLGGDLARRVARLRPALAARVAWWLVEGTPTRPTHHGLHFQARGDSEPLYVAVPTVSDTALAPPGHSIVYTLLHAPPEPVPTSDLAGQMRARLAAVGGWPEARVVASGVTGGEESCYGYAIGPGLWQSFRVSPRLRDVGNVVLAGGSVFPGPGVANVIRSGLRAANLVEDALCGERR